MSRQRRHNARAPSAGAQAPGAGPQTTVVIRPSRSEDEATLTRLAQLDGVASAPAARSLVAEVEGEVLAALPLEGGGAIADPFRPTAALVEMLELRAAQLRASPPRPGLRTMLSLLRLGGRTRRSATAPATPGNGPLLVSRD